MRYSILLFCIIIIASCAKKGDPVTPSTPSQQPTPQNPNPTVTPSTARFIPNWVRDTLVGQLVDVNGAFAYDTATNQFLEDTLVVYSINDTSFVEHSGIRYYLWTESLFGTDTFENNAEIYVNCKISLSTAANSEINQYQIFAGPSKFYDTDLQQWANRRQQLYGHDFYVQATTNPKYKVYSSYYSSIK